MFSIFKGKVVLVTGNTGFKGSWLTLWLKLLGAEVIGISNGIPSKPSHYESARIEQLCVHHDADILNLESLKSVFRECKPDFLFHLAAQALVKRSFNSPTTTMATNALGTVNILEAIRSECKEITAVIITSDKVYDNVEWVWGYREDDKLGGKDPYSASKAMAEIAIRSFFESYLKFPKDKVRIGVARAGNVIGGGDWAEDRIVPDAIRAWTDNKCLLVRNPNSTRPWQHVLEPLGGYLMLACSLKQNERFSGQAYNFGPKSEQNKTVGSLIAEMQKYLPDSTWKVEQSEKSNVKESGLLKLNCDKALLDLNWQPALTFEKTVEMTASWYRDYYFGSMANIRDTSNSQIASYMEILKNNDSRL